MTAIPILDLSLAQSPGLKPQFLFELRNALVHVGFFYVRNHPILKQVQKDAVQQSMAFFNLPLEKKLEIETVNSKHFRGYNRMGVEMTGGEAGQSESISIGPGIPAPSSDEHVYFNLFGPSQWPDEAVVPGFRKALGSYRSAVQAFAAEFTVLIEEALDLETTSLARLFGDSPFSCLKVIRYSPPSKQMRAEKGRQGIGAHKDAVFMTYLLQRGEHNCLEVQDKLGTWIPVLPIPETLVVNVGQLLEILTRGVCTAATHRVLLHPDGFTSPRGIPLGPRVSIPFFQHVNLRLIPEDLSLDIPPHIADLTRGEKVISDAENFFLGLFNDCAGDTVFFRMLTSYQEAAKRWYPDLLRLALKKQYEAAQFDQQKQKA